MYPQPPKAKGQSLLLLCTPCTRSPHGPYGPYTVVKMHKTTKKIMVCDEISQTEVMYDFDQCVRILNDDEDK